MKTTKTCTLTIFTMIITLSLFIRSSSAITGNFAPDQTPYVGVVVLFGDAARQQPIGYCSGFLLSPTVMVTAGHSLVNAKAVSVCFDKGPISYAIEDGKIVYEGASTIYEDKLIELYPHYIPSLSGNIEFKTSDIGLIILDQPVAGITEFPELPQAGFTDNLKHKTNLEIIGYGMQYQNTPKNNGVINSWVGTISQNSATVQFLGSNFEGS